MSLHSPTLEGSCIHVAEILKSSNNPVTGGAHAFEPFEGDVTAFLEKYKINMYKKKVVPKSLTLLFQYVHNVL